MDRGMLERDHELGRLATAAREAADGAGSVALVHGEAGIGKSSLVKAMSAVLPRHARILVGACDDLATGRPLGPFRDLVGGTDGVGEELAKALRGAGDRHRVYDALRSELTTAPLPVVLVVEDVHWADEASLDALRFLVRRMERLPALLVLTYRDDELGREHPLRQLLGQVSRTDRVHRLALPRLSRGAVGRMSRAEGLDPAQVYAVTSGNPFFVAEVLAAGNAGGVPPTVVDAVLARLRGLDAEARDALEQLAVLPSAVEHRLADALLPDALTVLGTGEQHGLLTVTPERVVFRHELIRRAIADSLPAARRITLNREVLRALIESPGADPSRIVHHAAQAGDEEAIARFGPVAAADASRTGAHREAAAQLRLVLRDRQRYGPAELAALLEQFAVESYTIADSAAAVAAQREAVALRRSLGDTRALGADLRWLSRIHWWAGDADEAQQAAQEAIAVLEGAQDERLLALALSNTAQLHMLSERHAEAVEFGLRAIALARATDDAAILSHALNNVGCARWRTDDPRGRTQLEEALRVALAAGEVEHACRAYANLIWNLLERLEYAEADRYFAPALELADRAEHLGFLSYLQVELAMRRFAAADWEEAERYAELAVHDHVPGRCPALTVLGRVRIRRGAQGGPELLTQAWEMAVRTRELQRTGAVAAARAEAAWLGGDVEGVIEAALEVYEQACVLGSPSHRGELGYWLTRAGHPVPPDDSGHPYALQSAGRWRAAAEAWRRAGCPYEEAAALAQSPGADDKLGALARLDALGAEPLARQVRAELRTLGVRRIPRGPLAATRDNPAGLTERQLQVLRLMVEGLTNPQIAERLVVSVRTVDHHVSAVLEKLGTSSRGEATVRARELGLT
ncbi:AAA family ATPase [Streptomyces sp. N35]|uniref:ATP-binding protein n=1 Tax=Streptomyces sp. N35 TaxID=2795730 RepID=UPI0018F2AAA3|nr:LuxR family transcriptional regulator [Streptomyces sp. N35]